MSSIHIHTRFIFSFNSTESSIWEFVLEIISWISSARSKQVTSVDIATLSVSVPIGTYLLLRKISSILTRLIQQEFILALYLTQEGNNKSYWRSSVISVIGIVVRYIPVRSFNTNEISILRYFISFAVKSYCASPYFSLAKILQVTSVTVYCSSFDDRFIIARNATTKYSLG